MMRIIILGILTIFLAGCQTPEKPIEQAPPPIAAAEEAPEEPIVITPPRPRFIMENIMGLTPDTLLNILGEPSLRRHEREAEVWLYGNSECRLHLYYYPDDNGDFRLDYVAAAAADPAAENPTVSPNACLNSLVIPEKQLPDLIIPELDQEPSYPGMGIDPLPDMSDN
ncbi:MAG: hypothetical protein L3J58_09435 [Emcibacter sp.]|nr:hypothetical protein [Emcibacter sp.]